MTWLDRGIHSPHCLDVPHRVHILANSKRGTLDVGVTNDLVRRVFQHQERVTRGFASRCAGTCLVHFEQGGDPRVAIRREKTLKHWSREWKIALTEKDNPEWRDLMTTSRPERLMPGSSPGMTKDESLSVALRGVRRRAKRDGFLDQFRAEVRLPRRHPSSPEGNAFLEAALAELAEERDRLEGDQEDESAP